MKYTVDIEKMDHQGRGIAFVNGVITFIPNALPLEKIEIQITKHSKKYNEARLVKIIKESPKRILPACPYYSVCGGCNMMHLSYSDELEYKENKIREIINRFTNIDINKIKKIIPNSEFNYRNKATFQVKETIGYYKDKSYEIICVDKCLIVDDKINEILKEIKKINLEKIYQIVIRVSKDDSMVVFKANTYDLNIDYLKDKVNTIVIFNKDYKVITGKGYIIDKIGEYSFNISPESFFQVNSEGTYNLYNKVLEYVENSNNLLDLYCGTGTIGIFLSKICNKIIGIEINKYAVEDAVVNKNLNKVKNIDYICNDASYINELGDFDTVVVDPPRSGMDKNTINNLLKLGPNKIVYVSCDPITLVRDLNILNEFYDVLEITPVDMFSKTYHIETVCVLEKK